MVNAVNVVNQYSHVLKCTCWRPVTHVQTLASYSAVYRFFPRSFPRSTANCQTMRSWCALIHRWYSALPSRWSCCCGQHGSATSRLCRWDKSLDECQPFKLNRDKTQFIWLGTPHQLSKLDCQTITLGGVAIHVSTEAMCLGVLLGSTLTFASHVRHVSGKSFYHLRQLKTVRRSLSDAAAKTMVHAFIISRVDYCNSVLYGVSTVHLWPILQSVLNSAAHIILFK